MATGPGHMPPGRLRMQQGLPKWHQGGWGDNRPWPHGTRVAGIPTGPGQGSWDGNRTWPHGTRVAEMATGPGHMAPGRLGWQQGLATWHQDGFYGYIAWPHGTRVAGMATGPVHMAPVRLGWQQGLTTWLQGSWDYKRV